MRECLRYSRFAFAQDRECWFAKANHSVKQFDQNNEGMPEWSNGAGLGPVSLCLRGFESSFPHLFEPCVSIPCL